MTLFFTAAAAAVLVTLALGLVRVLLGPTDGDRMLGAQLIGTAGVAILALLSAVLGQPALIDVALVLALLAAVSVAALTGRAGVRRD